jgi:hypothetical protein
MNGLILVAALVAFPVNAQVLAPGTKVRVVAPDVLGERPTALTWAGYDGTRPVSSTTVWSG